MLLDLNKVLSALGLVSSITKPIPVVGDVVSSLNPLLQDTFAPLLNSTLAPLLGKLTGDDSLLKSLLGPKGALAGLTGGDKGPLGPILGEGGLLSGLLFANATGLINSTTFVQALNITLDAYNITLPVNVTSTDISTTLASFSATNFLDTTGSCDIEPYQPGDMVLETFEPFNPAKALVYRYRQQQSVNLGTWFVQEGWMNPSFAACGIGAKQSELDIAKGFGGDLGKAKWAFERHWDTWITEQDLAYLASIGVNTVRLPIGYWSLGPAYTQGTDFEAVSSIYTNSWPRIVRTINWAAKYNLGVLVDLHGAPGSQNGQSHSGVSTGQTGLFASPANMDKAINALKYLAEQLIPVNNVVGIEILNEPSDDPGLIPFYERALTTLRAISPQAQSFPFYVHNAFNMAKFTSWLSTRTDFVVQDEHSYFVFSDVDNAKKYNELASAVQQGTGTVSQAFNSASAATRRNLVIDEWSCAISENALAEINDKEAARRGFCTGQMQTYANVSAGWAFWAYKTEFCETDENWCFKSRVGKTLPSTFYSYPGGEALSIFNTSTIDTSSAGAFFSVGEGGRPILSGLSTPDSATLLLAASGTGSGMNDFYAINELLATSEYDELYSMQGKSKVAKPANGLNGSAPSVQPLSAPASVGGSSSPSYSSTIGGGPGAGGIPSLNTNGVSSSNSASQGQNVGFTGMSAAAIPPPQANIALPPAGSLKGYAKAKRGDRFLAMHERREQAKGGVQAGEADKENINPLQHIKRQLSAPAAAPNTGATMGPTSSFTPQQSAIAQGYADGFKAAKSFAQFSGSRLGFTGQFVHDALSSTSSVGEAERGLYETWFMSGLADGEVQVLGSIRGMQGAVASAGGSIGSQ